MKAYSSEIQNYINANLKADLHSLLLKKSPFEGVTMQELVQQIRGRRVAEKKFPFLLKEGIRYPVGLSLEQSSSETTARYKAQLMQGDRLADLTSGFGIDAYFLSENFRETTLVEQNRELLDTVRHNWGILNKRAAFVCQTSEDFLAQNNTRFDWIYMDPARRDHQKNKVFLLEDLSPNLLRLMPDLRKSADKIMIKLSPLIDISYLALVLENISAIHIVAVKNDVKEILVLIDHLTQKKHPEIVCVNLETDEQAFVFNFGGEGVVQAEFSDALKYLYIPNNSLLKSGAFNLIGARFGLKKLHPNTHLYTSDIFVEGFPGRVLRIENMDAKSISKNAQFNIISKNHPLKPEEIKKKYRLKDGGERYLIFTQDRNGKVVLQSM